MADQKKPVEKPPEVAPDAWERFERAVDVVIKAKPKHRAAKKRAATKGGVRKAESQG